MDTRFSGTSRIISEEKMITVYDYFCYSHLLHYVIPAAVETDGSVFLKSSIRIDKKAIRYDFAKRIYILKDALEQYESRKLKK